ncbi:MAG: bifunctional nicotinamidase/pyrazinamidase [Alphaproteobacteria bacterium]|nr:bifunctional nicotinamidase/pyrazinamidase [Alphaproteobacteria bacterium]
MARYDISGEVNVLIVVDPQNDFCPGGALAVPEGDAVVPLANRLARAFDNVVLAQDWHPPGHKSFASSHPGKAPYEVVEMPYGPQVLWPDHCVQGTEGAEIHAGLAIPHVALVIRKGFRASIDSYSAFFENDHETPTGLTGYLHGRGLGRVFLTGIATDFCVQYSALDAVTEGFTAVVIEDACRGIDLDGSLAAAVTAMRDAGVEIAQSVDVID